MNPCTVPLPVVVPTTRRPLDHVAAWLNDRLNDLARRLGTLLRGRVRTAPAQPVLGGITPAQPMLGGTTPAQPMPAAMTPPDGLSDAALRDIGFAAWQIEQRAVARSREVERWLW